MSSLSSLSSSTSLELPTAAELSQPATQHASPSTLPQAQFSADEDQQQQEQQN
jgi:hypothetical protein